MATTTLFEVMIPTSKQLAGKVALVTGASRGIGRAIALELANRGATIAISFRTGLSGAEVVRNEIEQLGGSSEIFQGDISDKLQARAVVGTLAASSVLHPTIAATLRNARSIAIREITIFPSDGPLNDARYKAGVVISFVMHALRAGTLTQEKIAEAKGAIEDWMKLLKAKPDAQPLPPKDA